MPITPTTVHAQAKAVAEKRDMAKVAKQRGWTVTVSKSGVVTLKK